MGYTVVYEADLRCYPNYSFEIGDVTGNGRLEFICLTQNGNRLRVVDLDGQVVCERRLVNHGNWGTVVPVVTDLDGDGCAEIVVPSLPQGRFEARIVALDAQGKELAECCLGTHARDDYGIAVPLLAAVQLSAQGPPGLVAAVAGGEVVGLDGNLREVWRVGGLRNDFGHELYVADVDGDGLDEVAFCTCDHINQRYGGESGNVGELILLDHDGSILVRRRVDEYLIDTHFDDIAMADFRGVGHADLLVEKGFLLDPESDPPGQLLWDVSTQLGHGQWIAHAPDPQGRGRLSIISELWGAESRLAAFSGAGEKRWDQVDLPRTRLDPEQFPGWKVLPTRCHVVQWSADAQTEIVVGEQACSPTSHDCFATRRFGLQMSFLSLTGELLDVLPFEDAQVEGYWYNGEVRSRVADIDGDGQVEVIFPRQSGHVMVIKKV